MVFLLGGILILPGVMGLVGNTGPSQTAEEDLGQPMETLLPEAPAEPSCPDDLPACPWTAPQDWLEWARSASLEEIEPAARKSVEASTHLEPPAPSPDQRPGYDALDEETKKAHWLGWWLRPGTGTQDPYGADQHGQGEVQKILLDQQNAEIISPGEDEEEEDESELGDPYGLRSLWRLVEHGAIQTAHPADDAEAQVLVASRGIVYLSAPEEGPEWLMRFPTYMRGSQVSEPTGDGSRLLGLENGYSGWGLYISFPGGVSLESIPPQSLRIVDLGAGEVVYEGFDQEDDEQAASWTFTDITGDGEPDLLAVTDTGFLVAVDLLDGEEVYRVPLPDPMMDLEVEGVAGSNLIGHGTFGDATGDGVQDLYLAHYVNLAVDVVPLAQGLVVTLVSGNNGEVRWQSTVDAVVDGIRIPQTQVAGDLDGDGRDDFIFSETRYGSSGPVPVSPYSSSVIGLDAQEGDLFFWDDSRRSCPEESLCPRDYRPIEVIDLDGDGRGEILGMEVAPGSLFLSPVTGIVVRSLPEDPTPWTEQVMRKDAMLSRILFEYDGQLATWQSDGSGGAYVAGSFSSTQSGVKTVYRIDGSGVQELSLSESLVLLTAHPDSGESHAWIMRDDHWAPLDGDLERAGEGFRLNTDIYPRAEHDVNGDGVPDLLLRMTAGYQWIDGRDGKPLLDVERSGRFSTWDTIDADDGVFVLEAYSGSDGTEYRFGPLDGDPSWTIRRDALNGDSLREVGDYTGDGSRELLVHEFGRSPVIYEVEGGQGSSSGASVQSEATPERWFVRTPSNNEPLWEYEADLEDYQVTVRTLEAPPGKAQPLLMSWVDGSTHRLNLALHEVGKDGPVWEQEFDEDDRLLTVDHDRFIVRESSEEDEPIVLRVHRTDDGSRTQTIETGEDERFHWARIDDLGRGGPHVVYSYSSVHEDEEGAEEPRQQVHLLTDSGQRLASFTTVDPGGELSADGKIVRGGSSSYYSGHVGDWNGDGFPELVIREEGRTSIRTLDGDAHLAVAREGPSPVGFVDLNGDGAKEIGMRDYDRGLLLMMRYDPAYSGEGDGEENGDRVDLQDDGNLTRDQEGFFDEPRSTPGPTGILLVVLVAGLLGVRRGLPVRRRR